MKQNMKPSYGMKMAKACGATRLKIFGDSQLVAQQVMNQCDAINDSMIAYKEVYNELELFDGCEETPFFLVHGAEAVLPIEIEHGSPRVTEYNEEVSRKALEDDVDALSEARDEVLSRVTKYQQDLKNYHSRRLRPRSFQVGDLVLRLNQQSTEKLESPWLGPYIVTVIDGGAYGIKDKKTGFPRKTLAWPQRFYA
ncbi:hypothetical protein QYE76_006165 [Lolium multiflorum]|uniref:RNase H type-1 domain-containing protein n=1 Tax=Lolium multiflorum TaxID=4521 RepID=A0AAD8RUD8_LOLMU|nr:hypothetical protein QYE76_006165 [Lolium multiflorum]